MILLDELGDRVPQVPLAEGNDAIETLLLNRPDESLGVRIGVRRAFRRQDHADASLAKPLAYHAAPLPIPITDQHAMTDQRAVIGRRHPTHELIHDQVAGHADLVVKVHAAGVPTEWLSVPYGEHGYDLVWGSLGGQMTRKVVADFLESHLPAE